MTTDYGEAITNSLTRLSQDVGADLARRVAEMYCEQAPALLDSTRQAVAVGDRVSVVRHIHDLGSTSGLVGAEDLARTAAETEVSIEEGADLSLVPMDRLELLVTEAVTILIRLRATE